MVFITFFHEKCLEISLHFSFNSCRKVCTVLNMLDAKLPNGCATLENSKRHYLKVVRNSNSLLTIPFIFITHYFTLTHINIVHEVVARFSHSKKCQLQFIETWSHFAFIQSISNPDHSCLSFLQKCVTLFSISNTDSTIAISQTA